MHVRALFLWAPLALMSARCGRPRAISPCPDPTFSPAQWQRDSTGCGQYRAQHYESLQEQEPFFRGKPVSFMRHLLGTPQLVQTLPTLGNRRVYRYYYAADCGRRPSVADSSRLSATEWAKQTYRDVAVVVFEMRADTCRHVRIMVP